MEDVTIRGSEIDKITMFETVKGIMIELMMGYPAHIYWGIIEGRFPKGVGEAVRDTLEQHGLIEVDKTRISEKLYRLTSKGVDFAISLSQLDYAKKMNKFTRVIIILTIGTFIFAVEQIFILLFS